MASADDVNAAVVRAHSAQPDWLATPVSQRLRVLKSFQQLLTQRKREIAATITSEAGKPVAEALLTEVLVVLDAARFLLNEVHAFLRDERVPHGSLATKAKRGRIIREPYGVIGIISPWNYPFAIPATQTLAALATGNAVVLKPSELTPYSSLALAKLLNDAGLPPDLLSVVVGDGSIGAALVEAPIDKLVFTGSVSTGKRIAQTAAQRLLPVLLELGGKDAMIVFEDADLEIASSGAVWGAFVNAGQACLSVERCYVQRGVYVVRADRAGYAGNLQPAVDDVRIEGSAFRDADGVFHGGIVVVVMKQPLVAVLGLDGEIVGLGVNYNFCVVEVFLRLSELQRVNLDLVAVPAGNVHLPIHVAD